MDRGKLNVLRIILWIAIGITFARGLFVFDMGASATQTYPAASAICLAGSVVAAALMYLGEKTQKGS